MAEATEAPKTRSNPAKADGKKTPKKAPALYHLYSKDEKGVLTPVGDQTAPTAASAATRFLNSPPNGQASFAKEVKEGKAIVVVIPERNYTEVGAIEEVKRSLKIQVRK
jgi:hypothetical protein